LDQAILAQVTWLVSHRAEAPELADSPPPLLVLARRGTSQGALLG